MTTHRVTLSASPSLARNLGMIRALIIPQFHDHAVHKGETFNEATAREVERQPMAWVEDDGKDDDGDPTGFYAEIGGKHIPNENREPEIVMIVWEGESA